MGNHNTRRQNERGITLVMTALFLFVLLAMAAIAIDLGIAYTVRTSAQHAADASALAGAFAFQNDPGMTDAEIAQAAVVVANQNKVLGQPISLQTGDVTVNRSQQRVTVTFTGARLNAAVRQTYFARAMGWSAFDIRVTATAEASPNAGSSRCLKPFYLPNTVVKDPGESNGQACGNGHVMIDDSGSITQYALNKLTSGDNKLPVWKQDNYKSQWGEIKFVQGNTGNVLRCTIKDCLNDCAAQYGVTPAVACGDTLATNQGAKVDPAADEMKELINQPNQDQYVAIGQYLPNGSSVPVATSKSLLTVAIYDNCPVDTIGNGSSTFQVIGYAQVFVEYVVANGQDKSQIPPGDAQNVGAANKVIASRLVDISRCGGTPSGSGSGAAIPIRLVHPN